jgi:hypothetical protein
MKVCLRILMLGALFLLPGGLSAREGDGIGAVNGDDSEDNLGSGGVTTDPEDPNNGWGDGSGNNGWGVEDGNTGGSVGGTPLSQTENCTQAMVGRLSGDSFLNIRQTPDRTTSPIGKILDGESTMVERLATGENVYDEDLGEGSDRWALINHQGVSGYVNAMYLLCSDVAPDVNVVTPPAATQDTGSSADEWGDDF